MTGLIAGQASVLGGFFMCVLNGLNDSSAYYRFERTWDVSALGGMLISS